MNTKIIKIATVLTLSISMLSSFQNVFFNSSTDLIDVGYEDGAIRPNKQFIKEWIKIDSELRTYDVGFDLGGRDLTERKSCLTDAMGHDNCPTKSDICPKTNIYSEGNSTQHDNNLTYTKQESEDCLDDYEESDDNLSCVKLYSYYTYSCSELDYPDDYMYKSFFEWSSPADSGGDCSGTCVGNNCSCNSSTPPSQNCKLPNRLCPTNIEQPCTKAYTGDGSSIQILKRDLHEHNTSGTFDLADFGSNKNYSCGKDCGFDVNKVEGIKNQLCFSKPNNTKACITVNDCLFSGVISSGSHPLKSIFIDDMGSVLKSRDSLGSITSTCKMNGSVGWTPRREGIVSIRSLGDKILFWDAYKDGDLGFIEFIKNTNEKDRLDGFSVYPDNLFKLQKKSITSIDVIDNMMIGSSGPDISPRDCATIARVSGLRQYASDTHPDKVCPSYADYEDEINQCSYFIGNCQLGHNTFGDCLDFNEYQDRVYGDVQLTDSDNDGPTDTNTTVSMFSGTADKSISLNYLTANNYGDSERIGMQLSIDAVNCGGIELSPQPNHYRTVFSEGETIMNSSGYCDDGNSYFIAGKNSSKRTIVAIWDNPPSSISYRIKGSFVTIRQLADKEHSFFPLNPTCQSGYSYDEDLQSCSKDNPQESFDKQKLKSLSGNRFQGYAVNPSCGLGEVFVPSLNRCLGDVNKPQTCLDGKYNATSQGLSSNLSSLGIWGVTGKPLTIDIGFSAELDGLYLFEFEINGNMIVFLDGERMMAASNEFGGFNSQLSIGIHRIKIVATSGHALAFTIGKDGESIVDSANLCNTSRLNSALPCSSSEVLFNGACYDKSLGMGDCEYGDKDFYNKCYIKPQCMLVDDDSNESFSDLNGATKEVDTENWSDNFICSPLVCKNGCQEAVCKGSSLGVNVEFSDEELELIRDDKLCVDQECDANKDFIEFCGVPGSCPTEDPRISNSPTGCKEKFCPIGIFDLKSGKCLVKSCKIGFVENSNGLCVKQ